MPMASPIWRSLSDSFVKSRLSVAWPVTRTRKPPCPSTRSTTATTGAIFVSASFTWLPGMLSGISVLCRSSDTCEGACVW